MEMDRFADSKKQVSLIPVTGLYFLEAPTGLTNIAQGNALGLVPVVGENPERAI